MNEFDFRKYYLPAAVNVFGLDRLDNDLKPEMAPYTFGKMLDDALGITIHAEYCERAHKSDFPLPDKFRELCEKLKGPHGKAILKAYQIKHGIVKDEPIGHSCLPVNYCPSDEEAK